MCVCVCVCVCVWDPCAQNFKLRDNFERLLCWLYHWLSCMLDCIHDCVFLLSKNWFLKVARHLLDTLLSVELLKPFSYRNLDSSSIPGGSIENTPASSIASRHLVDRSSFYSWIWWIVARYLLNTSAIDRHFLDTLIYRALLKVLFKPPYAIRSLFHSISLSITLCFLSQTLSSHSNLNPQRFLQAFSRFSSLGKLLISHSSCISCFET